MNNEQTIEEILWDSINPHCKGIHEHLTEQGVQNYRNAASAVISHVLQGAKYVLVPASEALPTDEIFENMKRIWIPVGTIKYRDEWPVRRPISPPSSSQPSQAWKTLEMFEQESVKAVEIAKQDKRTPAEKLLPPLRPFPPGLGNPEGASATQCASSGDAGADIPVLSSTSSITDAFLQLTEAANREIHSLTSERDQLRKELEEAKKSKERWKSAGISAREEANQRGQENLTLTTENAALEKRAEGLSKLLGDYSGLHERMRQEIDRLRSQFRWTPISEAPKDGTHILAFFPQEGGFQAVVRWANYENWEVVFTHKAGCDDASVEDWQPTYWMPIPETPPPSPPETEEDVSRANFELWARKYYEGSFVGWDNDIKQYKPDRVHGAWLAWQAAKSTGGLP